MNELIRFREEIVETYGCFAQVHAAIAAHHTRLVEAVVGSNSTTSQHALLLGDDNPNAPNAEYFYRTTLAEAIKASAAQGTLHTNQARATIVLVMSTWEHQYRQRIAAEIGLAGKDELTSEVFADLNHMRRAILHIRNRMANEPTAIRIYRKGDIVTLASEHMKLIFEAIIEDLNRIGREHYGSNPQFRLYAPLNTP